MNVVIMIGRLTKAPELRYVPSTGKAVANFTIAVDRAYTTKDGEKQTDFFSVQVWGKQAENCTNYLDKGRLVAVKGSMQNRSYENKNGENRYITELIAENIQFLEWGEKKPSQTNLSENGYRVLEDDDVPF
jgi:single-strand DNA-binding protein